MPMWHNDVVPALVSHGVGVKEIEVEDNKSRLEQLGVSLSGGVPRVMFFNHAGVGVAHTGERTGTNVVRGALAHLDLSGGGGELSSVTPAHVAAHLPATVLYFRHSCGYCVRFLPTFTEFSVSDGVGTVVGVDTTAHPAAMGALNADAQSPGVPHVVYHGADGTQTPFTGERTVVALRRFVKTMSDSPRRGVSFEGGRLPVTGSSDSRLSVALNKLQEMAGRMLGAPYSRVFEPENSFVSFVAVRELNTPSNDRVYILLEPNRQPRGKPTAHAAVYGSRMGELTTKIYVNKDISALLRNKRAAGFLPVRETDSHVQALQTFGYHVGLS